MTLDEPGAEERVAVLGTGLIGTSIAMAAGRLGIRVRGFDPEPSTLDLAAGRSGLQPTSSVEGAVEGSTLVFVCTPMGSVPAVALEALRAAPQAVVTDVGSVKSHVIVEVEARARPGELERFVGGHPMGGSERSGPTFASESVVDGIVWVVCPSKGTGETALERLEAFVARVGARAVRIAPDRHDRLVAIVSHLPQVASTALMDLAATEESGEPEILLLAAGGFRDLTRLAASSPELWGEILLANREQVAEAIELYAARLLALRDLVSDRRRPQVEEAFARAKRARLSLAAKPQVRAGVAVVQVPIPDRPGALAELTRALGEAEVNIEDLQIVHSPEGGRGVVHLTVAAGAASEAARALEERGLSALRLA
jgi:prephenate dehydrogenase